LAKELYSDFLPASGTVEFRGIIGVDRLLGLLPYTIGDLNDAQRHFEDALAFCRKAAYRPELS